MIIPILLLIHIARTQNMKSNTCMDVKIINTKNRFIHTKIRNKTTNRVVELSFVAIFC